eukprot:2587363-Pleurochrysis_carterae.AAC.1
MAKADRWWSVCGWVFGGGGEETRGEFVTLKAREVAAKGRRVTRAAPRAGWRGLATDPRVPILESEAACSGGCGD